MSMDICHIEIIEGLAEEIKKHLGEIKATGVMQEDIVEQAVSDIDDFISEDLECMKVLF